MSSTFANISFNSIAKALTMAIQVGVTTLLARTLGANDYGVVGVAMVVIGFLTRFDDIGMTAALIQRQTIDDRVLATAQTINLALASILFLAAQIAAPFTAHAFNSDAVPFVVHVLGATFLINAIGFLPTATLTREMEFAKLRGPAIAGTLVRGAVAVLIALAGGKHWSLVIGLLAGTMTTVLIQRKYSRVHAGWGLDRKVASELLHYGLPLWGSGILTFVVLNIDNFFIGTVRGTSELGYYAVALNWSTFACGALGEVVHSVLFPRFSQLQSDRANLSDKYARSLQATVFIAFMANAGLFAIADGFLFTVLGKGTNRWLPSLAPLQILCIYGALRASMEPIGSVLMATGKSKLLLWANLIPAVIEVCLLPLAAKKWGLPGVAVLVTCAFSLQWFVYAPFVIRTLGFSPLRLLKIAAPGIVAAVAAVMAARSVHTANPLSWLTIALRGAVVCTVFAAVHELLSRGAILAEIGRIVARLKRRDEALVSV